ncbi:hypothetical protein IKF74_03020 [Candidatus Saccharibacteria bacterium]|nr:hypothetical protein [Candidatus Saccharibacteria bacterium]
MTQIGCGENEHVSDIPKEATKVKRIARIVTIVACSSMVPAMLISYPYGLVAGATIQMIFLALCCGSIIVSTIIDYIYGPEQKRRSVRNWIFTFLVLHIGLSIYCIILACQG